MAFLKTDYPKVIELGQELSLDSEAFNVQNLDAIAQSYANMFMHTTSIEQYEILVKEFPNHSPGYVSLANQWQKLERFDKSLEIWEKFLQLESVQNNDDQLFKYGNALLEMFLFEKAHDFFKMFITNFPSSPYGWYGLSRLALIINRNKDKSRQYLDRALHFADSNLESEFMGKSHDIIPELEYKQYFYNSLAKNPDNAQLLFFWANTPCYYEPLASAYPKMAKRYENIVAKFPDNLFFLEIYAQALFDSGQYDKAENLYESLMEQYPYYADFQKQHAMIAHHQEKWVIAKNRFEAYKSKFCYDFGEWFYFYIETLIYSKNIAKARTEYLFLNKNKFLQNSNSHHTNNILQAALFSDYDLMEQAFTKINRGHVLKFKSSVDDIVKPVLNDKDSDVLVICFQGVISTTIAQYNLSGFDELNFTQPRLSSKLDFDFKGFAKKSTDYNFLFIRDIYNSCHLINVEKVLSCIKSYINKFKPNFIVCTGISGGGIASLIFSRLLNANLNIAIMPRLHTAFARHEQYYYDLMSSYDFKSLMYFDVGYSQKVIDDCQTLNYIIHCDKFSPDSLINYTVNTSNSNYNITHCHGSIHGIMQYLGARNVFAEMDRLISLHSHSSDLPILSDAFKHIPGFKFNSTLPLDIKDVPHYEEDENDYLF